MIFITLRNILFNKLLSSLLVKSKSLKNLNSNILIQNNILEDNLKIN